MISTKQEKKLREKSQVRVKPLIQLELQVTILNTSRLELIFKKMPDYDDTTIPRSNTYLRLTAPRLKLTDNQQKLPVGHVSTVRFSHASPALFGKKATLQRDIKTGIRLLGLRAFHIEVLDKYLLTVVSQHQNETKKYKYLTPLFMPDWRERDKDSKCKFKELDFQLKHMPKDPIKNATIIAPIYAFRHIYLTIFDFESKKISVYDSMWTHIQNEHRLCHINCLLKILAIKLQMQLGYDELNEAQKWSVTLHKECAQQDDNQKCGYYVVYFTESILSGKNQKSFKKVSLKMLENTRNKMMETLFCNTTIGEQIFKACSV